MTKFNQRLLALAIAGAIALPGAASAATLAFNGNKQITYARDLIVNDGTTIQTPANLRFTAQASDGANIGTVGNMAPDVGRNITVKVTLTNGAKFDTTAVASNLVNGFIVGAQLGGDGATTLGAGGNGTIVGTPFYSTSGQELNFTFTAPGDGAVGVAGDFAIELNSFAITNLMQSLGALGSVDAEITAQNQAGQQILASRATIANSKWGVVSTAYTLNAETAEKIDVSDCGDGNRLLFSPNGDVGNSCGTAPDSELFNAGGLTLDIAKSLTTGTGGTQTYINNFNAVAVNPQFNVVNTARWTFTLTGTNLAAFDDDAVYLSADNCATGVDGGTLNAAGTAITFVVPATDALVSSLSDATPGPSNIDVCFIASGATGGTGEAMVPQDLSLAWTVDYRLPTQRVNPPGNSHGIEDLELNGSTLTFQNVNPAGNTRAQSFIRLTNHNDFACPIVIDAKDDAGNFTADDGNTISYTLPKQASWTINSDVLENGSDDVTGSLGDGEGRWYVRVTAECANVVGSALNRNYDTGVVTNLTSERDSDADTNDLNLFGR